eukprot:SAG11_NODE_32977_length_279_cov_2.594444_1_plen_87_part_01
MLAKALEAVHTVVNALAGEDVDHVEVVLAQDSDAVASVFPPEQKAIGALLNVVHGADGGEAAGRPSLLCYAAQALCMGCGALVALTI